MPARLNTVSLLVLTLAALLAAGSQARATGSVGGSSTSEDPSPSDERPNVVLILADDMGYSDIASYGGSIETPNLSRLSEEGLRFTQFYNTARCVPTRASLLTGLYPHQAGLGHMTGDDEIPGYRGDLNDRSVTIAEVLGEAGYSTYMSGKWHVTQFETESPDRSNWPRQRGFDRFFGTIIGAGSFYDPAGLALGNEYIAPREAGPEYTNENFYYTEAISDYAVRYVREHVEREESENEERPFFMYVAYTAPHWPLHAPQEAVERYDGQFDAGWDVLRRERYERMQEMGLVREEWDLTERDPEVPPWTEADDKAWEQRRMEVYAAQVTLMDRGIGRLVEALEERGELENTLLIFLSDNGGCQEELEWIEWHGHDSQEDVAPPGPRGHQGDLYPPVTRSGEPIQHGNMPAYMPGPVDTYQSYGRPWANVSNTPYREYKHLVHEGGIATPLIAHWPEAIDRAGELERQPGHLVDLMATFVDLADATYPERWDGEPIRSMEGTSLLPAFEGEELAREDPLFFEHEGNRALRDGRWKLVAEGPSGPWELYDMQNDRTEMRNLAERHPDRVERMAEQWRTMAREFNAVPWPHGGAFGADSGE